MTDTTAAQIKSVQTTTFTVLFAISFCHLLNDMMQSLLPAIYPTLKADFHLSFAQVGLITFAFQCTASLLQPAVGYFSDSEAHALFPGRGHGLHACRAVDPVAGGLLSDGADRGHALSASARRCSIPNPAGWRAWRPAAATVWRNRCSRSAAIPARRSGPLGAACGCQLGPARCRLVCRGGADGYSGAVQGRQLVQASWPGAIRAPTRPLKRSRPAARQGGGQHVILLLLIFSKYFYLTSITSYYTFYLIHTFHISVRGAQLHLFLFLGAVAAGTLVGGPLGDKFGRKYVIWFSILGMLPFTLMLALRRSVLDRRAVGDHRLDHGHPPFPPSWSMPRNCCPAKSA